MVVFNISAHCCSCLGLIERLFHDDPHNARFTLKPTYGLIEKYTTVVKRTRAALTFPLVVSGSYVVLAFSLPPKL